MFEPGTISTLFFSFRFSFSIFDSVWTRPAAGRRNIELLYVVFLQEVAEGCTLSRISFKVSVNDTLFIVAVEAAKQEVTA